MTPKRTQDHLLLAIPRHASKDQVRVFLGGKGARLYVCIGVWACLGVVRTNGVRIEDSTHDGRRISCDGTPKVQQNLVHSLVNSNSTSAHGLGFASMPRLVLDDNRHGY